MVSASANEHGVYTRMHTRTQAHHTKKAQRGALVWSNRSVDVGCGMIDPQSRPASWANPYTCMALAPRVAARRFTDYLTSRADAQSFLEPLAGEACVRLELASMVGYRP